MATTEYSSSLTDSSESVCEDPGLGYIGGGLFALVSLFEAESEQFFVA